MDIVILLLRAEYCFFKIKGKKGAKKIKEVILIVKN